MVFDLNRLKSKNNRFDNKKLKWKSYIYNCLIEKTIGKAILTA